MKITTLGTLKVNNRKRSGLSLHLIWKQCTHCTKEKRAFHFGVMGSNHLMMTTDDEHEQRRKRRKKGQKQSKLDDREDELESIFKQLKEKHQDKFSGPQLRLWARMIAAKTHDDLDDPPRVPMITGSVKRNSQPKESLSDAFASAATAIAKVLSPIPTVTQTKGAESQATFSPGKKLELRMKNLEQLRQLQQLLEDGILSQEEFASQKIVLCSLNKLL